MEKIIICQALGTPTLFSIGWRKVYFVLFIIFITTLFFIQFFNVLIKSHDLLLILAGFIGFLGARYRFVPLLEINSLKMLIYSSGIQYHAIKLKKTHYCLITDKGINLCNKKQLIVFIPFYEFEATHLKNVAQFINDNMKQQNNFNMNEIRKEGFTCRVLEGKNMHHFYRKELASRNFILGNGIIVTMVLLLILVSIIELFF